MIEKLIAVFVALVFFTLAGVFALVLTRHVDDSHFSFTHIEVPVRPGTEGMPNRFAPNAGMATNTVIGPDGKVTSQTYLRGQSVDAPLHDFASGFNKHIDDLNRTKASETSLLITLDIVGIVAAALTGFLELLRPFLPRGKNANESSSRSVQESHQPSAIDGILPAGIEKHEGAKPAENSQAPARDEADRS